MAAFSVAARSQLQCKADCFPHEHLACEAQRQVPSARLQQVVGLTILDGLVGGFLGG